MKLKLLACAAIPMALGGCDLYEDMNRDAVTDTRAKLVIENAGTDAVLRVNGETVGRAAAYDDESKAFRLSQGTYMVDVWQGKQHVLTSTVPATDGTVQTITVPAPPNE